MKCENCLQPFDGPENVFPRICGDCLRTGDFRTEPFGSNQ